MQLAIAHGSEALELSTITAKGLCDVVPDVGLFVAEEIVAWRDAHGAFPDRLTLIAELGLGTETASELTRLAGRDDDRAEESAEPGAEESADANEESAEPGAGESADAEPEAGADSVRAPESGPYVHADGLVEIVEPGADADSGPDARLSPPVPPPLPVSERPVCPAAAPVGRWRKHLVAGVVLIMAVNAGLAFGIAETRREGRRAVAPIAAMASDLHELKNQHADSRSTLDATRAELEETRRELAEQSRLLQATAASATELAAQQRTTDRELKDLAKREASDIATLAARLRERRNADGTIGVSLGEAVQLIDATYGSPPAAAAEAQPPRAADHEKPVSAPPID